MTTNTAVKTDEKTKTDIQTKPQVETEEHAEEPERISIPLTPENAKFIKGAGGLVSLTITEGGKVEEIERVLLFRSFPITNPDEFISVREPDSKKMGRGREIGMVRYIKDFDPETRTFLREELDRRYFTPVITKIYSAKDQFGYSYWDAETDAGRVTFILRNPFTNIRILEDGRIYILDMEGNSFQIPDPAALDSASLKKIEMYL